MTYAISTFRAVIEAAGLRPGEIMADGTLHRCPVDGKPNAKDGAYVLHVDAPASGWWQNYRTGDADTWTAKEERRLSPAERQALQARIEEDRRAREAETVTRHAEARKKALYVLAKAQDCTAHPYLERKGARACHGLKVGEDGRLLVPVLSPADGKAMSLQTIAADGGKLFLSGGCTKGGYFAIKGNAGPLYIAEGLATGLSIHEATKQTVLCAFNAGNLEAVATHARQKYPDRELVLCADDDHATPGNPGLSKATAAALDVGAFLAVPSFKEPAGRTDFNDLHQAEGLDVVRAQLAGASKPVAVAEAPIEPVSFDALNVPDVDPALLPPILGEFCGAVAEGLQVPFELVLINALSCVAVAGQRKFKVQVRPDYTEPVNIYALAALPPGERKSATAEACKRPLIDWETEAQEEARESIRNTLSERKTLEKAIEAKRAKAGNAKTAEDRRALIDEIRALEAELPEVPAAPRLLIDDVTPEAIPAFMERQQERAGIIEAEGGLFDILAGRYSKGVPNLDAVLKLWSGEAVHVDRRSGQNIVLHDPALTICLSPQPDIVRGLADKPGFRGRGLLGRFLFLLPKSRVGSREVEPQPISQAVQARYAAKVRGLLALPWALGSDGKPVPYLLQIAPDAYREWADFHRDVEAELRPGGELELIADWGGKLHGAAARLVGLLHLVEHDAPHLHPIGLGTMQQALGLAAVLTEHAKAAFALMGADPDIECAKHILAWIVDRHVDAFQAREAFQAVKGRYSKMELVKAGLSILEERAYIFPAQVPAREPGKAGRSPSPGYSVNPLAFGGAQ
ncbi:putative DNA primase/helicase [Humidesulfovibrio mexicanus]|uniref:Putative DNA primase/helicase n=1 Tax=Humidesulfovibrio mexicanus TaxID=147047 RepID=A0A238ZDD0_9BACT|nr:DUF3987 domain-containing protein [Humidesulfovibrio mexicanus]SNR81535.1 putative DNA primase/helicase [Humidesulfovibrio mexicanus]